MSAGTSRSLRTRLRSSEIKNTQKNDALYAGYPFFDFAAPQKNLFKLSNNANLISLTKYFR